MKKVKIAILDSGVKVEHPDFKNINIEGFSLIIKNNKVERHNCFNDNIGHGTAIFYLIHKLTTEVDIINIKIYNENDSLNQENFEKVLSYICDNFRFDIINISMGIVNCNNTDKMQNICERLNKNGTIVISAFDNNGAISFPAALNNVIGVDGKEDINSINEFIIVQNSIVNILGKLSNQKVAWTIPNYNIVKGNSFSCCYVTANIAKLLQNNSKIDEYYNNNKNLLNNNKYNYNIKNASIFPFNKEIHSIARYEELLNFNIVDYYTVRISGNVDRRISDVIKNNNNNKILKDIDNIEWNNFDTLILGHLDRLSYIMKKDYKKLLTELSIAKGKNIYSFDELDEYIDRDKQEELNIYTPRIDSNNIPKRFGKLYKTNKPILSIVGTNSEQGKFTLQLFIRKKLMENGYKIGQIGTEPSSLLFGFDEVFPCGYNSLVDLNIDDTYIAINQMIWNISENNIDLIITGSQSGLLAYNNNNANMFPTYHQIFLEAIQPDLLIICINPFDDINFVERNIKFAESLSDGKVIGIVCFPMDFEENWRGGFGKKVRINEMKEKEIKMKYKNKLNINVYMLDREKELIELINNCLLFLRK